MDKEKDIEILKDLLLHYRETEEVRNAIRNLLAEREENKKYTIHLTDEQYRKVIENAQKDVEDKYKKRIEELEDENRVQRHQIMTVYDNGYVHKDKIKEDYIPKQKVKEKIEENNKLIEKCKDELEHYGEIYLYEHDNKILKELLEDK